MKFHQKGIVRSLIVVVGLQRRKWLKGLCLFDEKAEKASLVGFCGRDHPGDEGGVGSGKPFFW